MNDPIVGPTRNLGKHLIFDPVTIRWISAALIIGFAMVAGGYLMGDGLLRAKEAERSVTVRGLAERDVTANLATWTIAYSATSSSIADAQAKVQADTQQIKDFFQSLGFPPDALQPTGANVASYSNNGVTNYTVRQRMTFRTHEIKRAQRAVAQQFDLVSRGVFLEEGSGMAYNFTDLNAIKPDMVAEATRNARDAAEQFTQDSGAKVGAIRHATQGYFSIEARDGDAGGWGVSDTPYKKVRVVTTVDFSLE